MIIKKFEVLLEDEIVNLREQIIKSMKNYLRIVVLEIILRRYYLLLNQYLLIYQYLMVLFLKMILVFKWQVYYIY